MKLIVKNSPIENKILLLLGLDGLNKQKVMFTRLGKNNKAFRYLNSLPLKKTTIDYLTKHCRLEIKEVAWLSNKQWKCHYVFAS